MADETYRSPGQPRMPEVSGGQPSLSKSPAFPNPVGVNAGPAGRPPKPSPVLGGGASLPVSRPTTAPTFSAPSPRPSLPAGPQRPSMPSTGPQIAQPGALPRVGVGGQVPTNAPAAAAPEASVATAAPSFQLDRVPTAAEMAQFPQGTTINTPYGTVDSGGKLTPNPQTEQRYKEAVVARRKQYGPHPFAADPNAPQPPVELGKPSINPFTGAWLKG